MSDVEPPSEMSINEKQAWKEGRFVGIITGSVDASQAWHEMFSEVINNEGPNPRHHRKVMKRHRKEWPSLWKLLDDLLEEPGW
jgi:hypothetical protein